MTVQPLQAQAVGADDAIYSWVKSNVIWHREGVASPFGAESEVKVVPNVMTPLDADSAAKAISDGYLKVVGHKPTEKVLGLLLAQWALETGNGKYIHGNNFGNVKYYAGAPQKQYFRCSEIVNGVEVFYDPPAPQCAFAAYASPAEGAAAYVRILKKRAHWWAGLHTGDVGKFNTALSTSPKYYTANPTQYLGLLQNRLDAYLPQAAKYSGSIVGGLFTGAVMGAVVVAGSLVLQRYKRMPWLP